MWTSVVVLAFIGLASAWGVLGVAMVASLLALALSRKAIGDAAGHKTQVAAMVGAFLLPLTAVRWSESSSIISVSGVFLVAATMFVLNGLNEGAMVSFSHLMIKVLTTGYLLSYLPLIRALEAGKQMTWAFLLSLGGLYLAKGLPVDRVPSRFHGWVSPTAGIAAAVGLAAGSLLFLPESVSLVSMLVLGLTVATGGLVGEASEKLFSQDTPGQSRLWYGFGPLLLAAPAFFYVFHLYLT